MATIPEVSVSSPDLALLAKLEEENRKIEADVKSPSLTRVHSRKSSDTSQISLNSGDHNNGCFYTDMKET